LGFYLSLAYATLEICLGIRKNDKMKNPNSNFGVRLNLPKDESIVLTKDDYLVVLSEDEL